MRVKIRFFLLLFVAAAVGCVLGLPFHQSLQAPAAIPPGNVLLIGKFTVDPMVEQGNVIVRAPRGTHKGVIKMNFGDNADQPINKNSLRPFKATELMDFSFTKTSFIPVPPGTRYARMGTLMLDSTRYTYGISRPGSPGPGGVDITYIVLYGDVKIAVPENAKAVYIGTVVYEHDLKNAKPNMFGYPSKRVVVKDEFNKAMEELAAMNIPGITRRDVVKKLAVVVREN